MSTTQHSNSSRGIYLSTVRNVRMLCREHFEITLSLPNFPPASPGQFLQVRCSAPDAGSSAGSVAVPILRRPFSIGGLRRRTGVVEIDLLGRVVGPGTTWLSARRPGDKVDLLGPLGNCFSIPAPSDRALLIAGGIGLPPIRWFAEILHENSIPATAIFGAQTKDFIPLTLTQEPDPSGRPTRCVEEFACEEIDTIITTDDGSCGLHGRVTDALVCLLNTSDLPSRVYACGPEPMLRAVGEMCGAHGMPCELAMERVMACGMGTCQSCVLPVIDPTHDTGWRYALCCTEGPIFAAERIRWA